MPEAVLNEYHGYLQAERGLAAATRAAYEKAARDCIAHLRERPEAHFLAPDWGWPELDKRAVEVYLNRLRDERGWRPSSLRQQASALRAFFAFLVARGHIARNPLRTLLPEAPPRASVPPEGEEAAVRELFGAGGRTLERARLLAVLELIYGGGMRPSAVYGLEDAVLIPGGARVTCGGAAREVTLGEAGRDRLAAYLELRAPLPAPPTGGAALWVNRRGRPLTPAGLARAVAKAMERAGLAGGGPALRRLSARHFSERGGDVRTLRQFLDAKRLGNLDIYDPPDFQKVAAQFHALHPRAGD